MVEITTQSITLVALTGIVVEAIKRLKIVGSTRFLPLISLLVGGVLGAISVQVLGSTLSLADGVVAGIVAGAVASGTYDVISKSVLNK